MVSDQRDPSFSRGLADRGAFVSSGPPRVAVGAGASGQYYGNCPVASGLAGSDQRALRGALPSIAATVANHCLLQRTPPWQVASCSALATPAVKAAEALMYTAAFVEHRLHGAKH